MKTRRTTGKREGGPVAGNRGGTAVRHFRTLFEVGAAAALTDGQLLERYATLRGLAAELAFEALVERHGSMVFRACRSILGDDHEAMDAFQATFLVLARKGGSLWVRDSLGPWLHRVARRAAGKARAAANRRRAGERRLAELAPEFPATIEGHDDDLAAILHEEVDRLPERFRVPIVLCDLEGRTCEETARHLGCPVGTVGSRLSRGREKLRHRLIRRGVAPTLGALVPLFPEPSFAAFSSGSKLVTAGASSAAVARLAGDISRSLLMTQLRSIAATLAVATGLALGAGGAYHRAVARPQAPAEGQAPARAEAKVKSQEERDLAALEESHQAFAFRHRNYAQATIGNFRLPVVVEGVKPLSREAILYQSGAAKLFEMDAREPVATFHHAGPIRELSIFDEARLLVTTSDDSVKVWDALTGEPRKTIEGQVILPLFHALDAESGRFATIDIAGRIVTLWDTKTLEAVATIPTEGPAKLIGAGLSSDGKILVTITEDRSVTFREGVAGRPFATLRAPSPLILRVFQDNPGPGFTGKSPVLQLDSSFWESVKPLLPTSEKPAAK